MIPLLLPIAGSVIGLIVGKSKGDVRAAAQAGYFKASEVYEKKIDLLMATFQEQLENVYGIQVDQQSLNDSLSLRVAELEIQTLEEKDSLSEEEQSELAELRSFYESLKKEIETKKDAPGQILGSTYWHIKSGGKMTQNGEWIFFVNPEDDMKLYKMNTKTDEKVKINDDKNVSSLNAAGEYLYYIRQKEKNCEIVKVLLDGSNTIVLRNMELPQLPRDVTGAEEEGLFSVRKEGEFFFSFSFSFPLSFSPRYKNEPRLFVIGEHVFFTYGMSLVEISEKDAAIKEIFSLEDIVNSRRLFYFDEQYIYYRQQRDFYKYELETGQKYKFASAPEIIGGRGGVWIERTIFIDQNIYYRGAVTYRKAFSDNYNEFVQKIDLEGQRTNITESDYTTHEGHDMSLDCDDTVRKILYYSLGSRIYKYRLKEARAELPPDSISAKLGKEELVVNFAENEDKLASEGLYIFNKKKMYCYVCRQESDAEKRIEIVNL
jgi:hypothetical protein